MQRLIETRTSRSSIPFDIFPTVASGDYQFVKERISEFQVTDVVVCGGDGSVNQVVHALATTRINFGIVPMGSGNGLAFAAGIPRNSDKALDIVFSGKAKRVDGFMVNDEFACMLCGLGLDGKVAHEFAHQPKRGLSTYAALSTRNFFSAKPYRFGIHANGIQFVSEAFFISIANSNQFGNNFTIAPRATLSDGLLDIVIVKKRAKPLLLFNVMRQVLAGQLQKIENSLRSPVIYFQTAELVIKNVEDAPMHIDGEPRETMRELRIKILPRYFNLIHGS